MPNCIDQDYVNEQQEISTVIYFFDKIVIIPKILIIENLKHALKFMMEQFGCSNLFHA
jgi:hypothetical protein